MTGVRPPVTERSVIKSPSYLLLPLLLVAFVAPLRAEEPRPAEFGTVVKPFLQTYCFECHRSERVKGDVDLQAIGSLLEGRDLEHWELVFERLESGEMPPEDATRQPDDAKRAAVAKWIEATFRQQVARIGRPEDVPRVRRLTNFEYENTIRDLIGFELKLAENLPEDPFQPYAFNNSAEFMLIGPEQMERYRENARRVMASAIVDPQKPEVHRTTRTWGTGQPERGLQPDEIGVYGNRRNTAASGMGLKGWPKTGEYRIRIKAAAVLPPGVDEVPLRLVMGYSLGENLAMLQVEPVGTVHLSNTVDDVRTFEFRGRIENQPVKPGRLTARGMTPPSMAITPQNLFDNGELNDRRSDNWALAAPRVVLQSLEFEAPVVDVWPPEHHTRILFDSPLRESDLDAYVRAVLERFLSRAFRRPATTDDVERFKAIYDVYAKDLDSFEAAMRETLALALVSPQFLYHTVADGETSRSYELASRLSYFLWGSMPDAELLRLAAEGKLDAPAVLAEQAERLLADERSQDFVENFTKQWLSIEKSKAVKINTNVFPRFLYLVDRGERAGTEVPYRPTIRDYMIEETVGFVGEVVRRNASVTNFVDSDFAYLNRPLAAHYGVEGVQHHALRPVPVERKHRLGGLLTHGSVLVGNSTGSAPHPIYRAVWLREAILGDEVKPPPAEVPALSDTAGNAAETAVSIKDLLRQHRQVESCNDCHVRLDPWGIPFERYNATGRFQPKVPADGVRVRRFDPRTDGDLDGYRRYLETVNTVEVEADARVPNGPEIDGIRELKDYLLRERTDDVAENVVRRLLTYALGRKLTYHDRFEVEQLLHRAEDNEYRMRDMVVAICQSSVFRGVPRTEDR